MELGLLFRLISYQLMIKLKIVHLISISYSEILACFFMSCEITSYFLKCRSNNMLTFHFNLIMFQTRDV